MSIDPRTLRQTVGQFATGVTVIAVDADGEVRAITVNSFTSLSLDPPLVLFCLGKDTRTGKTVRSAQGFSVNILAEGQQDLSRYFAGSWQEPAPPAFSFVPWDGGPRLEGCAASLACRVHAVHEGGDHWIVVGRVVAAHRPPEARAPLVFHAGRYLALRDG
jgi:flavin reductase (DIM6/NTAB) family NADH-FMN oxidoreductase RutF